MSDHLVDIVDERDRVIGKELKSKKAEKDFISRVAAVFIVDSKGRFLVCQRSLSKPINPGKWDLAACGNVMAGETYEEAAKRELTEETGICCNLSLLEKFYQEAVHSGKVHRYFSAVFLGKSDSEPKLCEELAEFRRVSLPELQKWVAESPDKFCDGFINDLKMAIPKLVLLARKQYPF